MLKKLRVKFVAVVMACVAVVLAVVFSGICITEYQREMNDVQEALSSSLDRAGEGMLGRPDQVFPDESLWGVREQGHPYGDFGAFDAGGMRDQGFDGSDGWRGGPRIGGADDEKRSLVPVGVYAIQPSGELEVLSSYTTAFIGDDVAESVSRAVSSAEDGQGEISGLGLIYQKRMIGETSYVAFADSSYAAQWQSLALTLVVAGVVVLAVFFVIALVLSKWALKPVEEAWVAQRQFVADASHELKTPLTVILANTSILLKHPEESIAKQSQWLESTQVEAESMQGLVNEMLELAQVESRAHVDHAEFDFSDMVDGEVLQFESVAFERGCSLEASVASGIRMNGDERRLRKMTSTLIENAMKYVDDAGSVDVSLALTGDVAKLVVRNTGSTIAPEDLPHIFDRFYRTDKARTSGAGGFGLGLAIARETAREHGGDIACESGGSGTVFTVTLPVA